MMSKEEKHCWLDKTRICDDSCKAYHALLNECTIIYLLSEIPLMLTKIGNELFELAKILMKYSDER
jgi:hypothetical protein